MANRKIIKLFKQDNVSYVGGNVVQLTKNNVTVLKSSVRKRNQNLVEHLTGEDLLEIFTEVLSRKMRRLSIKINVNFSSQQ